MDWREEGGSSSKSRFISVRGELSDLLFQHHFRQRRSVRIVSGIPLRAGALPEWRTLPHHDQSIGLGKPERVQQHAVNDGEERRGRADAECQGGHDHDDVAGAAGETCSR